MRTYDYVCGCGARFEAMVADIDEIPLCPRCGARTRRLPAAGAALLGRARPPASSATAPKSWEGTYGGDTEYIAHWRHALDERAKLEERHPELAARRSPVYAHEGPYLAGLDPRLTAESDAAGPDARRTAGHRQPRERAGRRSS